MNNTHLTFENLRLTNRSRCEQVFHALDEWTPTDWACAFAGEAGEACNAVKKLRRMSDGTNTSKDPQSKQDHISAIVDELADAVIYADLLAQRLGVRLEDAIRRKFNVVSIRMKSDHRL